MTAATQASQVTNLDLLRKIQEVERLLAALTTRPVQEVSR